MTKLLMRQQDPFVDYSANETRWKTENPFTNGNNIREETNHHKSCKKGIYAFWVVHFAFPLSACCLQLNDLWPEPSEIYVIYFVVPLAYQVTLLEIV